MTVPASKVISSCTRSEVALVRASRKGQLERLSHAELKRHAVRAKTLSDKWRDLSRSQSRTRSRKVGFGDSDANTALKAQIFREALESFEAQLAKVSAAAAPAAKGPKPKLKRHRTAEHRSTRAAIRKGMTAVEDLLNTEGRGKKKPAARSAAAATSQPKSAPAVPEPASPATDARPAKSVTKAREANIAVGSTKRAIKVAGMDSSKQRKAVSAAKKSRIVRSGKTTRMLGHTASRGKRTQARRDSRS